MKSRRPNFFVAGAQKAGTTYLCAQLSHHREIFVSDPKEPMFFNSGKYQRSGFEQYCQKFFSAATDETWVGEGSTLYFQSKDAVERIKENLESTPRFIVCLRHPVEKAVSLYMHNYRRGRMSGHERLPELKDGGLDVLLRSLYADSIERYFDAFGRENMLFLFYEDLVSSPADFVNSATAFLGLEPLQAVSLRRINAGSDLAWREGHLQPAADLEFRDKNRVVPAIPKGDIEFLQDYFGPDVERTEKLLGKSLAHWFTLPEFGVSREGDGK